MLEWNQIPEEQIKKLWSELEKEHYQQRKPQPYDDSGFPKKTLVQYNSAHSNHCKTTQSCQTEKNKTNSETLKSRQTKK